MQMRHDFLRMVNSSVLIHDRALENKLNPALFEAINGYGCWCHFGADYVFGKSTPVDEIDTICRTLHHGYECTAMDSAENCLPYETTYTGPVAISSLFTSLVEDCVALNPNNDCATRACMVEGHFIVSIFNLFMSGQPNYNAAHQHKSGF